MSVRLSPNGEARLVETPVHEDEIAKREARAAKRPAIEFPSGTGLAATDAWEKESD